MWLVLLEFAKDRFLGVDPLEQPVSPRVQYGTTCLLIRNVVGSVPCLVAWGMAQCLALDPHGASRARIGETIEKHDILL
jgi:hypothetical protein